MKLSLRLRTSYFIARMKSGKIIDVSKSSLVSLKAELIRKQEEVERAKGTASFIRPPSKKKKELKLNKGVEERRLKDEVSQEEVDLLGKSKEVLMVKSKLYDKLQSGESIQENVGDAYLVDFKEKLDKVFSDSKDNSGKILANDISQESESDDDDWVDYVDCLGRTRRCLKEDMKVIRERDDEMRKMLGGNVPGENSSPDKTADEPDERQLEMISSDMQREKMRQKWEEQEEILLNKKNIYYEDIRFDEARSHGVAYYSFSTDESKREEEQVEFKRLREETVTKQREAKDAKERRDLMKQARLMAARQRQRERLGLPPLSAEVEIESEICAKSKEGEKSPKQEETSLTDLEADLTRAAHVRPWDIGKDGVKEPAKVMTQEEWIEKKRDERPEEFAPPTQNLNIPKKKGKKRKSFHEIHHKKQCKVEEDDEVVGPLPEPDYFPPPVYSLPEQCVQPKQSGISIPPPPSFDYYTPNKRPTFNTKKHTGNSSKQMIESIEAGLELLRSQSEKRDKLAEKKCSEY